MDVKRYPSTTLLGASLVGHVGGLVLGAVLGMLVPVRASELRPS